ncbi:Hypothetical Protein yibP [Strawberry lethal yellows phytoplasma (CPA) str. NZSb11]|uniref:Uncharacterized protein n=1 Tax=Strawberry lethal yellows phytoplasma (CPA) str. NZSb11 TaxID=980422 RepID=R4RXE7_PHYAS|nr:hypothetical protein [Candidatus Phytoplasma australiense]AGL90562.1 Hypothetical Protein yibP [Strawberry lethal yellows phytoplasma (CPA) str. NZSb11]
MSLGYLKESQTDIDGKQKVCDEYKTQLDSIQPQIESLKPQQQKLEQQRDAKEQELDRLKKDRKGNENKIKKFQDEKQKIIEEISEVEVQIGKLESKQKMYQDMLSRAEMLKKDFVKSYERQEKEYRNQILNSLHNLYEITPNEG